MSGVNLDQLEAHARAHGGDRWGPNIFDAVREIRDLRAEAAALREDAAYRDLLCGMCPANVYLERHEHDDKGPHWHHYIDPGDGLATDCPNAPALETAYPLGLAAATERAEKAEAGEADALDRMRAIVGLANDDCGPDEEEFSRDDAAEAVTLLQSRLDAALAALGKLSAAVDALPWGVGQDDDRLRLGGMLHYVPALGHLIVARRDAAALLPTPRGADAPRSEG